MRLPILVTKLFIPAMRPEFVSRPHLIKKLNSGLHHKLTLISAPAGFGKTTLAAEWVQNLGETSTHTTVWFSLDTGDNELTRFLTYFVAALNQIEGLETLGAEPLASLDSPQPPSKENLLTSLINEIASVSKSIILVLDDYHVIDSQPINEAVTFLIENQPPAFHLVITTREDPLLPLSRLRARGQLTELRAADLRFLESEATEFLNRTMGLNLSAKDIAALESRTEGWIVGLQLAAISMQALDDVTTFIDTFTGSNRLVLDYLIEEVLDQQPDDIQNFLLKTAILDKLNGSLCDALTNQEGSQKQLEQLEQANLFVVPLDNERKWYRYHHLFADLLKQKLRQHDASDSFDLHRKASAWYQSEGFFSDAMQHAIEGNDHKHIAELAEIAWSEWNTPSKMLTWLKWVSILPDEIVQERPVLGVAYAKALLNSGQLESAEKRLNDVEELITQPNAKMAIVDETLLATLPAQLAATRAYHAQAIDDVQSTIQYVEKALELFPEDDLYNRAATRGFLGLSYWSNGNLENAYQIYTRGLFQNDHDEIKGTFVVADIKRDMGQLQEAKRICERGIKLAEAHDPRMPTGTEDIYTYLGLLYHELGKLDQALQCLRKGKSLGEKEELPDWEHRWCIAQAQVEFSLGNLDTALDLLDDASHLFVRTPIPDVRPIPAMQARIWIKQGRLPEAQGWADERNLSLYGKPGYLQIFEYITLCRLLLGQGHLDQAAGLLERLQRTAEDGGWGRYLIEILLLRLLVDKKLGLVTSVTDHLEQVLRLAEPEGFVQVFVDEGAEMASLLYEALSRDISPRFVQRLLAAYPAEDQDRGVPTSETEDADWIEPLSEREIEILSFIADGFTNQEIAVKIFLSKNTIKAHTRNIYGKLGVNNRMQAVARARTLGIL